MPGRIALALSLLCLLPVCGAAPAGNAVAPLAVSELRPGVFVHAGALEDWAPANGGDVANLAFVVGTRCVAVIDTGGTPAVGRALRAAVARATPLPVCYVINTHAHPDHVLGNAAFKDADAPPPRFVASARFAPALAARAPAYLNALARDFGLRLAASDLVYPDIAVERSAELDLGDRVLALTAWPTAHTDNDLTVYDARTRTLFASDLLFVRHMPALDGSLRGWVAAMAQLRQLPATLVVPGHGPAGSDVGAAMEAQSGYLDGLLRSVRAALREGLTLPQAVDRIGVPPGKPWLLADRFHRRNVTAAYAELEWEDTPPAAPAGARP
jgi:quinoprotein relay system zinc metallohydrolase 2